MRITTHPLQYEPQAPPAIVVHALKENRRPIGFAPWPEEVPPTVKRKKKRKSKTTHSNTV